MNIPYFLAGVVAASVIENWHFALFQKDMFNSSVPPPQPISTTIAHSSSDDLDVSRMNEKNGVEDVILVDETTALLPRSEVRQKMMQDSMPDSMLDSMQDSMELLTDLQPPDMLRSMRPPRGDPRQCRRTGCAGSGAS